MDGATAIALVSIVVGGTTAIAVPFISARAALAKDEQRFRQERLLRDFDELRTLLDEIAEEIPVFLQAVGTLESEHSTAKSTDISQFTEEMHKFSNSRDEMLRYKARLVIRLGRKHEVYVAFQKVLDRINTAGTEVLTMITLDRPVEPGQLEERVSHRQSWYSAYEGYLDAASKLVGSLVEPLAKLK